MSTDGKVTQTKNSEAVIEEVWKIIGKQPDSRPAKKIVNR